MCCDFTPTRPRPLSHGPHPRGAPSQRESEEGKAISGRATHTPTPTSNSWILTSSVSWAPSTAVQGVNRSQQRTSSPLATVTKRQSHSICRYIIETKGNISLLVNRYFTTTLYTVFRLITNAVWQTKLLKQEAHVVGDKKNKQKLIRDLNLCSSPSKRSKLDTLRKSPLWSPELHGGA